MVGDLVLFRKAQEFAARAKQALAEATDIESVKNVRDWSSLFRILVAASPEAA